MSIVAEAEWQRVNCWLAGFQVGWTEMQRRQLRDVTIGWLSSAVLHGALFGGMVWTISTIAPELSLESNAQTGEFSSLLSFAAKASPDAEVQPTPLMPDSKPEFTEMAEAVSEPVESQNSENGTWDDRQLDHRPVASRRRISRSMAAVPNHSLTKADLDAVIEPAKELLPVCEAIWQQAIEIPRQIDYAAAAKLLENAQRFRPLEATAVSVIESIASAQGTKVDVLPKPGPRNKPPAYPAAARSAGHAGLVMLTVTLASNGMVQDAVLAKSSGYPSLDNAALDAVRNWHFEPARRNGTPVEFTVDVPIRFRLTP